ncbi:MAG: ABC transporter ATP-binding protein [Bacillota bacterium]
MFDTLYRLNNVSYDYPIGKRVFTHALDHIDLTVKKGEAVTVVGPSGCGKSTLLYLLSGLQQPTEGEIYFEGKPLKELNRKAVLILQDYGLFPWKTVAENISLGLILNQKENRLKAKAIQEKTAEILKILKIEKQADKFPTQLSGGQRQRVAIGRALIMNPEVLLMDEPFAALDAVTKENLKNLIQDICRKHNLTLVFVTHNIEEAFKLGSKIIVFGQEPGRIKEIIDKSEPDAYNKIEKALGIGGADNEA